MSVLFCRATLVIWLVGAILIPADALAWDSGSEDSPGPREARNIWGWIYSAGPRPFHDNEHARLLREAIFRSGLPLSLAREPSDPFQLSVYTKDAVVPGVGIPTVHPYPFLAANTKRTRAYTIPGFAGLPDHSYSLADWVAGNETCPPGTTSGALDTAVSCHTFQFHLGLLNSTHFVPQSQNTFIYYHNLALTRAAECKRLSDSFQSSSLYTTEKLALDEMSTECEREALLLEAIGQHFLQDAWAIGHMWERWGYPTFAQFPAINDSERRMRALAVGLVSGLIHGAESKTHLPDLMNYGHSPDVVWEKPGYPMQPWGIGDLHASELLQDPQYVDQREFLLDCSASSLREVYAATGMVSGSLGAAAGTRRNPVSECFNQRATNSAIFRGLGLDPLVAALLTLIAGHTTASPYGDVVSPALGDEIRTDLVAITVHAALMSILFPSATDLAEGGLLYPSGPRLFVGSEKNSAANSMPPASYADPPLPWPGSSGTGTPTWDPARWISRAFNKAHVKEFCSDSETLPSTLRDRVKNTSGSERSIASEICKEFVWRQLRLSGAPSVCDVAGIPVNSWEASSSFSDRRAAAADYCGSQLTLTQISDITLNYGNAGCYNRKIFAVSSSLPDLNRYFVKFGYFRQQPSEELFISNITIETCLNVQCTSWDSVASFMAVAGAPVFPPHEVSINYALYGMGATYLPLNSPRDVTVVFPLINQTISLGCDF